MWIKSPENLEVLQWSLCGIYLTLAVWKQWIFWWADGGNKINASPALFHPSTKFNLGSFFKQKNGENFPLQNAETLSLSSPHCQLPQSFMAQKHLEDTGPSSWGFDGWQFNPGPFGMGDLFFQDSWNLPRLKKNSHKKTQRERKYDTKNHGDRWSATIYVFFLGGAFFGNMSLACYCHLKWPSFFGKDGHEGKKHPESMHTHHAQAPPSAKVPRIGGEYHFPMVADVSSHYFITYSKTPRICRMTKCCEQNDIFESWKKKLKLHFPVLLAGGIIPIIRSHKWPSYHKKSHGPGYEFSQQPSKGCGWSLPSINSEGAWDIYNKPKKSLIIWCPKVIHPISIFKTTASPKRKKTSVL